VLKSPIIQRPYTIKEIKREMQAKRENRGVYVESSFLSDDHPEKRRWQRCDSPAIPLKCSALVNIDFGPAGPNATETSGHAKIGLIDFKKQYERFSKTSVVGQFALQFLWKPMSFKECTQSFEASGHRLRGSSHRAFRE
jgi:hypothetical protein